MLPMSDYPPGVTGREWQIAGPDHEEDCQRYCPECENDVDGTVTVFDGFATFTHYTDDEEHETDITDEWFDPGPDPDPFDL